MKRNKHALAQPEIGPTLAHLDPQARALALFLVGTGARLSEALRANVEDIGAIDGRESVPVLLHGAKGSGDRITFLMRDVVEELQRLRHGPPFTLARRTYQHRLQRAGLNQLVLRHTFASSLLDNGADLISTMMLMGHSKADSTRQYFDFTEERLHVLARSIVTSLPRARRRAHRFVDLRDGRLDP